MPKIKHRKSEDYPNYKQKHSELYEDDYEEYDEDEEDKPEIKLNKYEDNDFLKYMYEQFEKTKEKPKQTVEDIRKSVCTYEYSTPPYEGREDSIGPLGFGIALWFIIAIGLAL